MQRALFLQLLTENGAFTIGIIIGSILLVIGVLLFTFNILILEANQNILANKDIAM